MNRSGWTLDGEMRELTRAYAVRAHTVEAAAQISCIQHTLNCKIDDGQYNNAASSGGTHMPVIG